VGRGFETPTLNELSYRPDGQGGLNFALQPAVNDSVEVGAKGRLAGGLLTAALFKTRTSDEIVTAHQHRRPCHVPERRPHHARRLRAGLAARDRGPLAHPAGLHLARRPLQRHLLRRGAVHGGGLVPAGNRIPGIAPQALFASYGWVPPQGWRAGTELRALSSIEANDRNTVSAPGYAVVALFAGYLMQWQRWGPECLRAHRQPVRPPIHRLGDRQRGQCPLLRAGTGRNWTIGMSAAYRF
jgi:iron complex outermembrane receptor protein